MVGKISDGNMYFDLGLPVDQCCRVKVVFPTDMPMTNDLKALDAVGLIAYNGAPSGRDFVESSFYLDGCTQYTTKSSAQLLLSMQSMKNKGYLQQTQSFKLYFYAVGQDPNTKSCLFSDATKVYPIAKQEANLVLADGFYSGRYRFIQSDCG